MNATPYISPDHLRGLADSLGRQGYTETAQQLTDAAQQLQTLECKLSQCHRLIRTQHLLACIARHEAVTTHGMLIADPDLDETSDKQAEPYRADNAAFIQAIDMAESKVPAFLRWAIAGAAFFNHNPKDQ